MPITFTFGRYLYSLGPLLRSIRNFEFVQVLGVYRNKRDCPSPVYRFTEHRLERTKGCHLYSLSRPGGSHLRMAVCISRKLLLMQWRHSAAWTTWCAASDTDTIDGFQLVRVSVRHSSAFSYILSASIRLAAPWPMWK